MCSQFRIHYYSCGAHNKSHLFRTLSFNHLLTPSRGSARCYPHLSHALSLNHLFQLRVVALSAATHDGRVSRESVFYGESWCRIPRWNWLSLSTLPHFARHPLLLFAWRDAEVGDGRNGLCVTPSSNAPRQGARLPRQASHHSPSFMGTKSE